MSENIHSMMENVDPNQQELVIPTEFKNHIIEKFILPYYKSNIEYVIKTKTGWSKVSTGFFTASTLLIGASSILSFASGVYPNQNLNFVAGSIGLIAVIFKEFASYANTVEHVKTLTINDLLKNIGINHAMNDNSQNNKKMLEKHNEKNAENV